MFIFEAVKNLSIILLLCTPVAVMAQDFCYTDNVRDFSSEVRPECKNLVIGNLSFINNGQVVYPVGNTKVLDSIAYYLAMDKYIYEIDYEARDGKADAQTKYDLESAVRNYLISKNQVNQIKAFREANPKTDHSAYIPEHMNAAFFFICIYPSTLK